MKKLTEYKKLNYRMVFEFDSEEGVYIVKFPELPGCIAHGETSAKALENALQVKDEWLEAAYEDEWIIPEPSVPSETSGRITLRAPKYLHEKVIDRANREGVSINQLILTFVAEGLERINAKDYLEEKMGQQSYAIDVPVPNRVVMEQNAVAILGDRRSVGASGARLYKGIVAANAITQQSSGEWGEVANRIDLAGVQPYWPPQNPHILITSSPKEEELAIDNEQ